MFRSRVDCLKPSFGGAAVLPAVLAVLLSNGMADARAAEGPRVYTNLQVLADTTSNTALLETMKAFSKALGVDCRYCHRTDIRDYATDELEAKRVAREMMRMVRQMNAGPGDGGAGGVPTVSCVTCHQGQPKPPAGAPVPIEVRP